MEFRESENGTTESDNLLELALMLLEVKELNQQEGCGLLVMLDREVTLQPRNLLTGLVSKLLRPQPFRPRPLQRQPQWY